MRIFLLIVSIFSVLFLYMLVVATGYANKLSEYFWWLVVFCGLLILILLVVLLQQLWRLWYDGRHHIFGAKLSRRLVIMFTLVTILPGLFLLAVSTQFIAYSINSWFGSETEEALKRSLSLSKSTLKISTEKTLKTAQKLRDILQDDLENSQDIDNIQDFEQIIIFNRSLKEVYPVYQTEDKKLPIPSFKQAKQIEKTETSNISIQNKLYTDIWLDFDKKTDSLIFFRESVAQKVANDVILIENARAKYAELSFAKKGLQTFFLLTLILTTLLAMMLSVLIAVFYSRRFVVPLQSLADATQAVAQGDFSRRAPVYRNDEMGMLSARFNRMTEQLQSARIATDRLHQEQFEAKKYLELVLASLTTGVMTFDENGCLKTFNESAIQILGVSLQSLINKKLTDWSKEGMQQSLIARFVTDVINHEVGSAIENEYGGCDRIRILLAKSEILSNNSGQILVFDDVTHLVRAQKEAAWGEVARRLAHEIRNPLTPIQLSAERMAWKLADKLPENESLILQRCTNTIIKQVAALQEMVESFRNYARSTNLKLIKINLNEIIAEVLVLYEGSDCFFQSDLSQKILTVNVDITAIRQVLHNLFKNAAEAALDDTQPEVWIKSEQSNNCAILTVKNNGKAFDSTIQANPFEPYVTNKPNGTGLGLAVVKKIVDEHKGRIDWGNNDPQGGAWIKIILPMVE